MENLESLANKRIEELKKELKDYALSEISRRLGGMTNLRSADNMALVWGYDDLQVMDGGVSRPIGGRDKLRLIREGIWPTYLIRGSFWNSSITHSDYNGSSFQMFLSTNYALMDYLRHNGFSDDKHVVNTDSLVFLRWEGITGDLWEKIVREDGSLKAFPQSSAGQKEKIARLKERFSSEVCYELKYISFMVTGSDFCNAWA